MASEESDGIPIELEVFDNFGQARNAFKLEWKNARMPRLIACRNGSAQVNYMNKDIKELLDMVSEMPVYVGWSKKRKRFRLHEKICVESTADGKQR